jgi:hypothetical protein
LELTVIFSSQIGVAKIQKPDPELFPSTPLLTPRRLETVLGLSTYRLLELSRTDITET